MLVFFKKPELTEGITPSVFECKRDGLTIRGSCRAAMEMNRQALQITCEDWAEEGESVDFFRREIRNLLWEYR